MNETAYETPDIISRVHLAVSTPLSSDYDIAVNQIDEVLALRTELIQAQAQLLERLQIAKQKYLLPQQKGQTELDRKIFLEANTSRLNRDYLLMSEFSVAVSDWLSISKVRLSLNKK